MIRNGLVIGVLDVDSDELNSFDQSDAVNLSTILELITFKS
jgi:putative methionine-R-sulfoxide reductase with GAF domain